MSGVTDNDDLIELVNRGGVFYNIAGSSIKEVLSDVVNTLPLPTGVESDALLTALLEREALMPTAVGNGIAIPHPRNPIFTDPQDQFISICFPQRPIDWKALDGIPVRVLILIVSASPKLHLRTLSKISFLCRQDFFLSLLEQRASKEELCSAIRTVEETWK